MMIVNKKSAFFLLIILSTVPIFSNIKTPGPFLDAGYSINTSGDEFSPSITADSKTLVFSAKTPGNKSHSIYISKNIAGSWSTPTPIDEINSIYNDETPFISADGNTIIFASDRPGGYSPPVTSDGKVRITFDLYISRKFDNKWSEPQLLNKEINTTWNERSPSISRDGKKFFFTRWPYMNLGRSKIFMADITKEGIVNARELPETINSGNFEIAFIPSYNSEKERYFFSSMREGGYGKWDIYYTDLEDGVFTNPINAGASINSQNDDLYLIEGTDFSMICSNRKGGPGGFDIFLFFNREVSSIKESADETKDEPIENEDFHLMNIYFKFNSSKIETSYYPYLYNIVLKMIQNPDINLTITGHADKQGSCKANYAVSLNRANAVSKFISSMGIDKSRLTIENKGDSKPAQKGKLYNMDRRVEFSFNQ